MKHMTAPNEGAFYGLTKRELFAAMFCAAAIANPGINVPNVPIKAVVLDSITMADSLIAELNEPKGEE